ncbi:MAG TPA: putative zinc-binding metallopeptidase [Pyrinomonadaceae bacterium]
MSAGRRWYLMRDEELLDLRLCDLPLRIGGTNLEGRIKRLYEELNGRGIRFKPHVWLGEEWFSPDGVPGIAIPFYLAHPRLIQLERKQMFEVEGGTEVECLRILRHEAGHALDTAYRLHFKRRWRELFGSFAQPYPDSYKPRPKSRNFVLNLGAWYAQAHPAEDFAETFAVWLAPRSRWRTRYRGWPALEKLEYVDELMDEIKGQPRRNRRRDKIEPVAEVRVTLREHYRRKRQQYAIERGAFYDRDLLRIFAENSNHATHPTAASFIRSIRREVREIVAEGTGVHQYTVDHVMKNMIERSKDLKLRIAGSKRETRRALLVSLTVHVMNMLHSGYHRIAV